MGMRTSVKAQEVFQGYFECRHCELEVPATVYAEGWGQQRGTGTEIATELAEEDAGGVASRTLQFVRCPRCGKQDPTGVSYRLQATIGAVVVGLVAMGLVFLYAYAKRHEGGLGRSGQLWLAAIFGAVFTAAAYWKWGRAWRGAEKRVRFGAALDPTELPND